MIRQELTAALSALEAEIATSEVQLAFLKYRRNYIASALYRVPPDILSSILLEVQKEQNSTKSDPWSQMVMSTKLGTGWISAMSSCRILRQVAISECAIWSFIDLHKHTEQWKSLCLERSGGHLLHLLHYFPPHNNDVQWDAHLDTMQSLMQRSHHIRFTAHRYQRYNFELEDDIDEGGEGPYRHPVVTRMLGLINNRMPNLISMDLHNHSYYSAILSLSKDLFEGGDPIHLRRLTLHAFSIEDPPGFSSLEWLALLNVQFYDSATGKNHLVDLLNQTPSLRFLLVDNPDRDIGLGDKSLEFCPVTTNNTLHTLKVRGSPRLIYEVLRVLPDPSHELYIEDLRPNNFYCEQSGSEAGTDVESPDVIISMTPHVLYIQTRVESFLKQAYEEDLMAFHLIRLRIVHQTGIIVQTESIPELHHTSARAGRSVAIRLVLPAADWDDIGKISYWANGYELILDSTDNSDYADLELLAPLIIQGRFPVEHLIFVNPYFEDEDYYPLLSEKPRIDSLLHDVNISAEDLAHSSTRRSSQLQTSRERLNNWLQRFSVLDAELVRKFKCELIISHILAERYAAGQQVPTLRFKYDQSEINSSSSSSPKPALRGAVSRDMLKWRVGKRVEWYEGERLLEIQIPGGSKSRSLIHNETDVSDEEVNED